MQKLLSDMKVKIYEQSKKTGAMVCWYAFLTVIFTQL